MEYEITGYLGSVEVVNRGEYKVANFYIANGGTYKQSENRYISHWFPLEAWKDDVIKKLEQTPEGSIISVKYTAVPRKIKTDSFNRNIIVWKATKIISWTQKEVNSFGKNVQQELPLAWEESEQ